MMQPRVNPGQAASPLRWASRNASSMPSLTRNRTTLKVVMSSSQVGGGAFTEATPTAQRRLHACGRSGRERVAGGIVDHALEVDDNGGCIADHPGVMTARQERDVARPAIK